MHHFHFQLILYRLENKLTKYQIVVHNTKCNEKLEIIPLHITKENKPLNQSWELSTLYWTPLLEC